MFQRKRILIYQQEAATRNCPNCGGVFLQRQLIHSSDKIIKVDSGTVHSTLWGVCIGCAERHKNN